MLAASPGTPAGARLRASALLAKLNQRPSTQSWLSNLSPFRQTNVVEWALPFQTAHGQRVLIEAIDAKALTGFLGGYLKDPAGSAKRAGYIVDGNSRVIADSTGKAKLGDRLASPAKPDGGRYASPTGERYAATASLVGSDWRVVLTEPTAVLYPALAGSRSWIVDGVLIAFALVALSSILFLRRMLISSERVAAANRRLNELNATLEERVAERTAARRASRRGARALERRARAVRLGRGARPARAAAQDPDVLRAAAATARREEIPEEAHEDLSADAERGRADAAADQTTCSTSRASTARGRELEPVDLERDRARGRGRPRGADRRGRRAKIEIERAAGRARRPGPAAASSCRTCSATRSSSTARACRPRSASPACSGAQQPDSTGTERRAACVIAVEDNGIGFDDEVRRAHLRRLPAPARPHRLRGHGHRPVDRPQDRLAPRRRHHRDERVPARARPSR